MKKEHQSPHYIINIARKLRTNMTTHEAILWNLLKNKQLGVKFRKQHPISRYILDFYCHQYKLALELDGKIHEQKKEYDQERDNFLKSIDITVLRFSNFEIDNNLNQVLKDIKRNILVLKQLNNS